MSKLTDEIIMETMDLVLSKLERIEHLLLTRDVFKDSSETILHKLEDIERSFSRIDLTKEWLTRQETLEVLDCSETTLRRLVAAGKIEVNQNLKQRVKTKFKTISVKKYMSNPNL